MLLSKVYYSRLKWVALSTRTGSEICDLAEHLKIAPYLIFRTNNSLEPDERLVQFKDRIVTLNPKTLDELQEFADTHLRVFKQYPLITLNGWMHIIPKGICEKYPMFNGHPGLIHRDFYPDLKGKDPQERVAANLDKYKFIGSVVHRVTPTVDDGEIMSFAYTYNNCKNIDDVYKTSKDMSIKAWIDFFNRDLEH